MNKTEASRLARRVARELRIHDPRAAHELAGLAERWSGLSDEIRAAADVVARQPGGALASPAALLSIAIREGRYLDSLSGRARVAYFEESAGVGCQGAHDSGRLGVGDEDRSREAVPDTPPPWSLPSSSFRA